MAGEDRLKELIARMVLNSNYWGYLFSLLRRKPNNNLPSLMGVSPNRNGTITLYYNPLLIEQTDDETIMHIIEHEGGHVLNKHIPRLLRILSNETNEEKKDSKIGIWNLAADCCINVQFKIPREIKIGKQVAQLVFPDKLKLQEGKATEYYYETLLERHEKYEQSMEGKCPLCGKKHDKTKSNNSENGNSLPELCEECSKKIGQLADDHSQWNNDEVKNNPDLNSLARKIEINTANVIRETTRTFKSRGTLPSNISELIDEILNPPQLPYHLMIRKLVRGTRISKFIPSSTRINRKRTYVFAMDQHLNTPVISPFPGKKRDYTFTIGILIDTSGSMGKEDMMEALSGIKGIIENDRHTKTIVIECDGQVQKEYTPKKVSEIDPNMRGRGGTTLGPGLFRFSELNPDIVVAFTDGYTEDINNDYHRKELPKKILWVITKNGNSKNLDRTGWVVNLPN